MVKTDESRRFPICATCGHPIKNREKNGVYDDGYELHHGDCIRDKCGQDSLLDQRKMSLAERLHSDNHLEKYVTIKKPIPSKYGARRVA